jgi:hypothetical protein
MCPVTQAHTVVTPVYALMTQAYGTVTQMFTMMTQVYVPMTQVYAQVIHVYALGTTPSLFYFTFGFLSDPNRARLVTGDTTIIY